MPPLSCYLTVSSSTYFVWSPKDKCSWPHLPLEGGRRLCQPQRELSTFWVAICLIETQLLGRRG